MEFIEQFLGDEFLSKAFILSMITGLLIYLKNIPNLIWNRIRRLIFFSVTIEQTDELYEYVERWLKYNYPGKYRNVIANINYRNFALDNYSPSDLDNKAESDYSESEDINRDIVSYRNNNDIIFIKKKGVYIRVDKNREKLDHAVSLTSLFFDHYTFSVFFFKKRLLSLFDEIVEYNQQFKPKEDNVNIYSFDGYRHWYKVRTMNPKKVDNIILDSEIKSSLLKDISNFINNKKWYEDRSIPYKRGYLFHGAPGNGKTSLALSLANHLNKSIYAINLTEVSSDSDLKSLFTNIGENAILLIEDIDAIFTGRKSKGKITFSALLNCLDGVFYESGMMTIITTNHIENLDPALIRDGRVDLKIEFKNPTSDLIKEYVEIFYDKKLNGDIFKEGCAMSKIQNMCLNNSIDNLKKELVTLN